MERVLVLSDIHANYDALRAVLDVAPALPIWCLGDVVGYYADVAQVLHELQQLQHDGRLVVWLQGNHDLACACGVGFHGMSSAAAAAARATMTILNADERALLTSLAPHAELIPGLVVAAHGGPDQPLDHYMENIEDARWAEPYCRAPVCLVGHTHQPRALWNTTRASPHLWHNRELGDGAPFGYGTTARDCSFLNPGSVGQSRDEAGFPNATYAVLDLDQQSFVVHRVRYDPSGVQARTTEWLRNSLAASTLEGLTKRLDRGE